MKILIIDDDPHKMRQLTEFLRSEHPYANLIERRSYQSGLKTALLEHPDIVVLDMTMPTFDVGGKETGGRERRYAGQQVLRQLRRKNSRAEVVIVTQFEKFGEGDELVTLGQLRNDLAAEFTSHYLGIVYYQAADSKWREDLRSTLLRVVTLLRRDQND